VVFIPRNQVRHHRPPGRPPGPIPDHLREILDETYRTNTAWSENVTDTDRAELRELLRLGTRYAERRRLSFRCRLNEDDEGVIMLTIWMQDKRAYVRRIAS
jgi:hypothetical protein